MKNKIRGIRGFAAVLLISLSLLAAGCSQLQAQEENKSLLIAGATQFSHYSNVFKEQFTEKYKNKSVTIQLGDTTPSVLALRNGAIDLAITSRDLNENEDDKKTKSYLVAKDALMIIVHSENPISNLSLGELKSIFSGDIQNWQQIGGIDMPITLVSADKTSDAYTSLIDLVMEGEDVSSDTLMKGSELDVVDAVIANKQAIGFITLKNMSQAVKALSIGKVEAEPYTIYSGRYPLTRSIYFVVKSEPSKITQEFIDYFISAEGQAILQQEGALPLH